MVRVFVRPSLDTEKGNSVKYPPLVGDVPRAGKRKNMTKARYNDRWKASALGMLTHDFLCSNVAEMYFDILT